MDSNSSLFQLHDKEKGSWTNMFNMVHSIIVNGFDVGSTLFSNGAHFYLGGFSNKKKLLILRYWCVKHATVFLQGLSCIIKQMYYYPFSPATNDYYCTIYCSFENITQYTTSVEGSTRCFLVHASCCLTTLWLHSKLFPFLITESLFRTIQTFQCFLLFTKTFK